MYDELKLCLSEDRLGTYLRAAGFNNQPRALELYFWNMKLSASFYPLIASNEVCLRNAIAPRLVRVFGEQWWVSPELHKIMGRKGKGIMLRARNSIEDRKYVVSHGRMTAELSLGFWRNMLLPKYEEFLWSPLSPYFPFVPCDAGLVGLENSVEAVRSLRNRISHHEPIFERDISRDFSECMKLLSWLEPKKADWLKPKLEIMQILRQRP